MAAAEVEIDGQPSRFCQQCSRCHALAHFAGGQRSCREQLARHAQRRRLLRKQRRAESEAATAEQWPDQDGWDWKRQRTALPQALPQALPTSFLSVPPLSLGDSQPLGESSLPLSMASDATWQRMASLSGGDATGSMPPLAPPGPDSIIRALMAAAAGGTVEGSWKHVRTVQAPPPPQTQQLQQPWTELQQHMAQMLAQQHQMQHQQQLRQHQQHMHQALMQQQQQQLLAMLGQLVPLSLPVSAPPPQVAAAAPAEPPEPDLQLLLRQLQSIQANPALQLPAQQQAAPAPQLPTQQQAAPALRQPAQHPGQPVATDGAQLPHGQLAAVLLQLLPSTAAVLAAVSPIAASSAPPATDADRPAP